MLNKLIALIPWALHKLYIFSAYSLVVYIIFAIAYALLSDLSVTSLNIIFGLGLGLAGILALPAIMSTDSGSSSASNILIGSVLGYPVVYIISLIASRWVPYIAMNNELALIVAALPLFNVLFFIIAITLVFRK